MNIVTKTALANFRRNKSRNILVGIAVLLTTILLTAVPMVLFGGFVIENEAIKEIYPTYHAMYRNVDEKTAEKMEEDSRIKEIGFREDPAYMIAKNEDIVISMVYADEMVCRENRLNLTKGRLPKKEDEIVVTRGLLKKMGLEGEIGDRITVPYQVSEDDGLSLAHEQEFTITGFQPDSKESEEKGIYSAMVSKAFADSVIPKGQHAYRLYVKLAGVDRKVTDEIEAMIKELGEDYGIQERDIVANSDMLTATYKDPAIYGTGRIPSCNRICRRHYDLQYLLRVYAWESAGVWKTSGNRRYQKTDPKACVPRRVCSCRNHCADWIAPWKHK